MKLLENIEHIVAIIGLLGGATGVFYARRSRRNEVNSQEVSTADQMVTLIKKTYNDAITTIRTELDSLKIARDKDRRENERLRRCVSRLEKAIKLIAVCDHKNECPISKGLIEPTKTTEINDTQDN